MKRCPKCNQTFDEEWLSFCTIDGTALVETAPSRPEPPPTIRVSAPPTSPTGQPTFNLPGSYNQPQGQPAPPPQPLAPSWQPPPPPAYSVSPQQGIAIGSLITGIFTITIGWCCYLGVITGPIAIGLGIYQLVQIKKDPTKYGGKPLSIVGIATAGAYFVFLVFIILIYGLSFLASGLK